MGKRGRVTSLNPATRESLCNGLKSGLTIRMACIMAGVGQSTFYRWMQRGEEQERGVYREFREAVDDAQETAKNVTLRAIQEIARGGRKIVRTQVKKDHLGNITGYVETTEESLPSLQALIWIAERRWPSEFAPRSSMEISNSDNPFEVSLFGQILMGSGGEVGKECD